MTNSMSTPARRRRRRSSGRTELAGIALAGLVAAMLLDPRFLTWAVITVAIAVAAYALGRLQGRPPARKPVSQFKQARQAAARRDAGIRAKADSAARRNGWLPPADPQATTLVLSGACAEGSCHLCDGCEHKCGHDSALIVARNEAAYDAAHPEDPPF